MPRDDASDRSPLAGTSGSNHSVTACLDRLKRGDAAAVAPLWERYFSRLVQLARGRLRGLARRASDEEDVALSAFHSFCVAISQQRYPKLDDRDDLWSLLVMHTRRKAINQRRHVARQKRGGSQTRQLEDAAGDIALEQILAQEPDPQFAAELAEQVERALSTLDGDLRAVALLKLQSHTNAEIAQQLGLSERTIKRKLALVRRVWQPILTESPDPASSSAGR